MYPATRSIQRDTADESAAIKSRKRAVDVKSSRQSAAPLRPEVKRALRLQLGDPHHAAALGGDKTRQQILQRDILRRHGVAASSEFQAGFGELNFLPAKVVWITDTENETRQPA
jgi:hypothetical protein